MTSRPDARIVNVPLYLLTLRVTDEAAESHAFASPFEATAYAADSARRHLDRYPGSFAEMFRDAGWDCAPPMSHLSNEQILELASAWDGAAFEYTIEPAQVGLHYQEILRAIRASGLGAVVLPLALVERLLDRPEDARQWLADNVADVEDAMRIEMTRVVIALVVGQGRLKRQPTEANDSAPPPPVGGEQ